MTIQVGSTASVSPSPASSLDSTSWCTHQTTCFLPGSDSQHLLGGIRSTTHCLTRRCTPSVEEHIRIDRILAQPTASISGDQKACTHIGHGSLVCPLNPQMYHSNLSESGYWRMNSLDMHLRPSLNLIDLVDAFPILAAIVRK